MNQATVDLNKIEPYFLKDQESDSIFLALSGKKIVIMDNHDCIFLKIKKICYIEGEGSYSNIYLKNGEKLIVSKTMKLFVEKLDTNIFFRVHKSFLININFIEKYVKTEGGYLIMKNGAMIPVSIRKRDVLLQIVKKISI